MSWIVKQVWQHARYDIKDQFKITGCTVSVKIQGPYRAGLRQRTLKQISPYNLARRPKGQ
jgi:hypothetical protein